MSTTRFHRMSLQTPERTPIDIIPLYSRGYCHNCLCNSSLELVDTAHLSDPLVRCVRCCSVLQDKSDALRLEVKGVMKKRREAAALAEPVFVEVENV